MVKNKSGLHYAWKILIGAMVVSITCQGPLQVVTANLTSAVVAELGCEVNQFTLLVSISAVVMALLYPVASKILSTKHIGKIIALGVVIEALAYGLMGTYRTVQMFYLSGFLIGVGGSIVSFMAFPILINMWFEKKAGMALGIVMACRGIGSAVWSPIFANLITNIGWRTSAFIAMILAVALAVPFSLIFFKRPQDIGQLPYGHEDAPAEIKEEAVSAAEWGMDLKTGLRSPIFYAVWLTGIMFSLAAGAPSYFISYSTMELGNAPSVGATAYSVMSVFGILCSLVLGEINDRFGVKAGLVWGCTFQIVGMTLIIMSGSSITTLLIGAAAYGLGSGMYTLQVPLLVRSVLGGKHYTEIWPILMLGNSLIGGGLNSSLALFYDIGGSYKGTFIFCITLVALALVMGFISANIGKKRQAKAAE